MKKLFGEIKNDFILYFGLGFVATVFLIALSGLIFILIKVPTLLTVVVGVLFVIFFLFPTIGFIVKKILGLNI